MGTRTSDLGQVISALPAGHVVGRTGETLLVAGRSGAFVVTPASAALEGAAHRAGRLADATRTALAEHLSWVPFVDAVVVVGNGAHPESDWPDDRPQAAAPASFVPVDMLGEVLVEGPTVIDDEVLRSVADLLHSGRLSPWVAEPPTGDGRIDLCSPTPGTPPAA